MPQMNEKFVKKIQNKAFFLDRDGVINKDNGYVLKYSQFFFLSGVKEAIRYINNKNVTRDNCKSTINGKNNCCSM